MFELSDLLVIRMSESVSPLGAPSSQYTQILSSGSFTRLSSGGGFYSTVGSSGVAGSGKVSAVGTVVRTETRQRDDKARGFYFFTSKSFLDMVAELQSVRGVGGTRVGPGDVTRPGLPRISSPL